MKIPGFQKIFGVGPLGALLSLMLLALLWLFDGLVGRPAITTHPGFRCATALVLILAGAGLHVWSFMTLQNWWRNDHLCTQGPFKFVRHPMYTAWITLITSGAVLFFNSWIMLAGPVLLHLLWHRLVPREEKMMAAFFGEAYRAYAARTGRFLPRFLG
jgi:protein-S-isoprenylcysteine O-methyltransferase Ste14